MADNNIEKKLRAEYMRQYRLKRTLEMSQTLNKRHARSLKVTEKKLQV